MGGDKQKGSTERQTLGARLQGLRQAKGYSLRDVEGRTKSVVSNAYLSQLENDKIANPSPHVLHALAAAYEVDYRVLMEWANYMTPREEAAGKRGRGVLAALAAESLTPEDEQEVLDFLAYLRSKKKRNQR